MLLVLWATPRSTSTAFEWMMRQRGDFECFHEPWNELYYYGIDRRSQRDAHVKARPGHTYDAVWDNLLDTAATTRTFVKDFAYSAEHTLSNERLDAITHTFLIREPERVVQGMAKHWPDCTWEEIGFESLHRLFYLVADRNGTPPPIMTSEALVSSPGTTTQAYCEEVGIEFLPGALEWEQGDRSAVSWYGEGSGPWHDTLRKTTGIARPTTTYPPLQDTPRLHELAQRAQQLYDDLARYANVAGKSNANNVDATYSPTEEGTQ